MGPRRHEPATSLLLAKVDQGVAECHPVVVDELLDTVALLVRPVSRHDATLRARSVRRRVEGGSGRGCPGPQGCHRGWCGRVRGRVGATVGGVVGHWQWPRSDVIPLS